jgi:NAD-dependent deacetylase
MNLSGLIERAGQLLHEARAVVVFSGAGLSTPSGIPDFRSPGSGLWDVADPFEVASLTAFRHHPERFYNWVRPLAARILEAQPNAAHHALVRLEAAGKVRAVITQNIDRLHQRAGSCTVHEIHGSLETATCGCCHRRFEAAGRIQAFIQDGTLPRCPHCNLILKPDVILMEEQLPRLVFQSARDAARQCDLMLVVGSSLEVMPAAGLPLEALNQGAKLILVNYGATYLDERADVLIPADVAEALPQMAEAAGLVQA